MLERILVIPNAEDPSQPAMRRAAQCAAATTEIEVFDVVYEPLLEGYLGNREIYEPLRARVLRERLERAQKLAKTFADSGLRSSANAVWSHPLDRVVAEEVRARQVGLVVAAPLHGRAAGLSHSDWRLVLSCPVPVLLVKSDGVERYRNIVAAVDPFHSHAKPADLDTAILHAAKELRAQSGATLTVVHCFTPVAYFGADLSPPPPPAGADDHRLGALRELLRAADLPPGAGRLVAGAAHTVVHDMMERGEADLVVMGALARGRLKELLIGSTAERVLHGGRTDVLLVKPPGAGAPAG
jgi:universal stress protein E